MRYCPGDGRQSGRGIVQHQILSVSNSFRSARGIRRYGFHGLSYEYIVAKLPEFAPRCANGKIIVAHLGNGANMCAINEGRSIATTMGFTPVDGLPMGTVPGLSIPVVFCSYFGGRGWTRIQSSI